MRRFAAGTDAGFAVSLINKKLLLDNISAKSSRSSPQLASHIEAVKPGHDSEEPISFGPTASLVNYGSPWILQTVVTQPHKPKGTVEVVCSVLYFSRFSFPFCDLSNICMMFSLYIIAIIIHIS